MSSIAGESPEENPISNPTEENIPTSTPTEQSIPKSPWLIEEYTPWMEYAVQQAQIAQNTVETTIDSAIEATRSRVDRIRTTSSAHFNQTIDSLKDLKSEYSAYEDIVFGKIKEGVLLASSRPMITTGAVLGVGILSLKRTRQFLYYNTIRLFVSEEALLSKADAKVKKLQESIDNLKSASQILEEKSLKAEQEMVRGSTKLRQTGKQIQGAINNAYKIERQAGGLKDILKELPSREASKFRTQVTNLAKEAKKERSAMSKEVAKISNYGISV